MSNLDVERLHARIDELGKAVSAEVRALCTEVAAMKASCVGCQRFLDAHELILRGPPGNGEKPGLVTIVAHHAKQLNACEREEGKWKWALIAAGMSVLSSVTTGVVLASLLQ